MPIEHLSRLFIDEDSVIPEKFLRNRNTEQQNNNPKNLNGPSLLLMQAIAIIRSNEHIITSHS